MNNIITDSNTIYRPGSQYFRFIFDFIITLFLFPDCNNERLSGSFARIIDTYVNKEKVLALEDAIHKMSGLSAATLGLDNPDLVSTQRGIIKEGFAADLLIFNPENVRKNATFDNPHQYAEGFDWVIVNGTPVIREGDLTGKRNGKVLRKVNTHTAD